MPFDKIEIEQRGDVGVIRLNVPESLNAISGEMAEEMDAAIDQLTPRSRALVLTANGRAFCAGADLTDMGGVVADAGAGRDAGALLDSHINPLMTKLSALPIPWISAVNGPAVGVGCSIALGADLIVAAESAYFLQAFTRIGLVPDGGSTWLLTRAIGRVRAMEMMLLGERIAAAQALDWGLINRVVPDAELQAVALALADGLAAGPTKVLGLVRKLSWRAADGVWSDVLAAERLAQREAGQTDDMAEGVRAFLEKRPAKFRGA
ncbi:enoyl-CoA hydratase-related protein [Phenylobacterium sp.]|uniref:enoyl-CoA hydratase-related protein n=1 Tax=Phenylobacterium sp. TaxID=1871053 RepID=UPI00301DFF8C